MNEIAGQIEQGHCKEEQRKAKLITHIDVLTFWHVCADVEKDLVQAGVYRMIIARIAEECDIFFFDLWKKPLQKQWL